MSRRRITRNWILAPLTIVLVSSAIVGSVSGADSVAGSQGTDTSLALTDSAVTVSGRGAFESLKLTVNQTKDLSDQTVSITWTGGQPTKSGPGRFASNYLQIFQCWGDDDGSVPGNPGPPPEQCEQGASNGTYSGVSAGVLPGGNATSRVISQSGWVNFDLNVGSFEAPTGLVWRPFRSVDGTVVNSPVNSSFEPSRPGGNYWRNPFFNIITTNEIPGAVTSADGRGAELFQVLTGLQSSGLGCGQRTQKVGNDTRIPKCWIVVVPRSTPTIENAGTPLADLGDTYGVVTSPVAPEPWANRISIPIDFNPVDSPCRLGVTERRIAGNELAARAIASWQPALCAGDALPPFSYASVSDGSARAFILSPTTGSPGMSMVQRPIDPSAVRPANPIVYAPITLSGITVGFNVERVPRPGAPAEMVELAGLRVADINLTPRLVAKLMTQSYAKQLLIYQPPNYEWIKLNPADLGEDPDFLQFNPEFAQLISYEGRSFSGLQLPTGISDAAEQVWRWVLSDPEAAAWLAGTPDEWGMRVNPMYNTTSEGNTTGSAFGSPAPNTFPKADPYCFQSEPLAATTPPPLCAIDWMPFGRSFDDTAGRARRAFDGARIGLNPFAQSPAESWIRTSPQQLGSRAMLSLTDTASAKVYGLQTARLSQAGDNGPGRKFIAPDSKGLAAGLEAMAPGKVAGVLEPVTGADNEAAYPLTTLTYAAIAPLALDTEARGDYAALLEYAAGAGQVAGLERGQLPGGYVPLPTELAAQTVAAAKTVRDLQPLQTATPAPATPAPATPAPATPAPAPLVSQAPETPPAPTAAPTASRSEARARTASNAAAPATETVLTAPTDTAPPTEEDAAAVSRPEQAPLEQQRAIVATPSQGTGPVGRVAVPVLGVMALTSALLALELTKRPRRSLEPDTPRPDGP